MQEVWKAIEDTEGFYEVSNHGRVRSVDRQVFHRGFGRKINFAGKLLAFRQDRYGYPYVQIMVKGKQKFLTVHRLVAKHFLDPSDLPEVNHIDLNKTNNNFKNLEWCTRADNVEHAVRNGRRCGFIRKLTADLADELRADRLTGMTYKKLGQKYGVDASQAFRVVNGERWSTEKTVAG